MANQIDRRTTSRRPRRRGLALFKFYLNQEKKILGTAAVLSSC